MVVGGAKVTAKSLIVEKFTPLTLSEICRLTVTFALAADTSTVDGENEALRIVGGARSCVVSVTVRSVGNPRVWRLADVNDTIFPAESCRRTEAFQTPAAAKRGMVAVAW